MVQAAPGSAIAKAFVEVAERLVLEIEEDNAAEGDGLVIDRSGGVNRHLPIAR